jgi:GAF domain-containing protein
VAESYAATHAARAYLGVPVRSRNGHVLGSFCVVDHQTRRWADKDCETLERLAHAAEAFAGV